MKRALPEVRARRVLRVLARARLWPWHRFVARADRLEKKLASTQARLAEAREELDDLRAATESRIAQLSSEQAQVLSIAERRLRRISHFGFAYRGLQAAMLGVQPPSDLGPAPSRAPEGEDRRHVESQAAGQYRAAAFVQTLAGGGSLEGAVADLVRSVRGKPDWLIGRQVSQRLYDHPGTRRAGLLGTGLVASAMGLDGFAWERLSQLDAETWLRYAPAEYLVLAGRLDPAACEQAVEDALAYPDPLPTRTWLDLTRRAMGLPLPERVAALAERFVAQGRADLETEALSEAEKRALRTDIDWVVRWAPRIAAGVPAHRPVRAGAVPIAVLGYDQPDRRNTSSNIGDYVQTIAALAHIVRHSGARFDDSDLGQFATELATRVPDELRTEGPETLVDLFQVDRDASDYSPVPDGTWMLAFGWYGHRIGGVRYQLPFPDRIKPLYISFHLNKRAILTQDMIDHLKACAPIGCRDWSTVDLLLGLDIPAFFSGCLTTTVRYVKPDRPRAHHLRELWIDAPSPSGEETVRNERPEVALRSMVENLRDALASLDVYAFETAKVTTRRLHAYLPARALGCEVDFVPRNRADVRFHGLAPLSDEEVFEMGRSIADMLAEPVAKILAGASDAEVRAAWSAATADQVARARARSEETVPLPTLFDPVEVAGLVRGRVVVVPASDPVPGAPMDVVLALDGNLKAQFRVVLDGLVAHASRPLRFHILCREHDERDFDLCHRLFPAAEFRWYPCDGVDYGDIHSMISHITVSTMDRLLLPELLDDVERVLYIDIDTLPMADVAPLFDLDLGGAPLAARDSETSLMASGYASIFEPASKPGLEPGMGAELIRRECARHPFDWVGFNAGVLLLDLDRMRQDRFCETFLPYASSFGMHDQHILNVYAGANRVALEPEWNARPTQESIADPKIVHWAGEQKPWRPGYVPYREMWQRQEAGLHQRMRALGADAEPRSRIGG